MGLHRILESAVERFVSEVIVPVGGLFDAVAMGRGEPGLPARFHWRGRTYGVLAAIAQWKESATEGGRPGAERYLRRHYYQLQMSDLSTWTVYFTRQPAAGHSPKQRWFLYTVSEPPAAAPEPPAMPRRPGTKAVPGG